VATAAEHLALYDALRASILARHVALGRHHRANLLSLTNHLDPLPAALAALPPEEREVLRRWNVREHERENPLMVGGRCSSSWPSSTLSSPPHSTSSSAISKPCYVLAPADGGRLGHSGTRPDRLWQVDGQSPVRCEDFLVDDGGRCLCVPATDHRHVALRSVGTLRALRTRADADAVYDDAGNGSHWGYITRRRRWEASMDELVGLFAGWAVSDRFVPAVRPLVRPPALAVCARLAANGWTQIRPCGGFGARGSTGVLPAFEGPIDHWIRAVAGQARPRRSTSRRPAARGLLAGAGGAVRGIQAPYRGLARPQPLRRARPDWWDQRPARGAAVAVGPQTLGWWLPSRRTPTASMSGGRPKPGSRRSAPSWPRCHQQTD
jgi:hypothetical protein